MIKLYKITVYILILLGIIQVGFTPFIYNTFNADAIWFGGAGLSYIFIGLYNLATLKSNIKSLAHITIILNVIGIIFTIAIAYITKEPQAYVALFLIVSIFAFSILSLKKLIK
jgi:hypothetical protein